MAKFDALAAHDAAEESARAGDRVYTMLFRPVGAFTLPRDVVTAWVRLPPHDAPLLRLHHPDTEVSRHKFGEFATSRPLTAAEMDAYQVKRV